MFPPRHKPIVHVKTDILIFASLGFCFQFNKDGDFITHNAGYSGGIYLVMDAMVDEYYMGPFSFAEGFLVRSTMLQIYKKNEYSDVFSTKNVIMKLPASSKSLEV